MPLGNSIGTNPTVARRQLTKPLKWRMPRFFPRMNSSLKRGAKRSGAMRAMRRL